MRSWIAAALAVCLGAACVFPLRPVRAESPATAPSDKPAKEYPTPAELIKRMKEQRAKQEKLTKVAYFDLSEAVTEKPPEFSLFGDTSNTLHSLVTRLHMARDDKNVKAVLLTLGESGLNLSQA